MNRNTLILRSVRFYWRTHLGVFAGVGIGAAVLVGALLVGDSVRWSLGRQAELRIGQVDVAWVGGDRFVRAAIAVELETRLKARVAPVLRLDGLAVTPNASHRANGVAVYGVDSRFFAMASTPMPTSIEGGDVFLSERLARQLAVKTGSPIVLRVARPSAMPRDMVLAANDDLSLALRTTVRAVVADAEFGRFGLEASQVPPYNAFIDLAWLQSRLDRGDAANMLLVNGARVTAADAALAASWTLADAELDLAPRPELGVVDVTSGRVFLDEPVTAAMRAIDADAAAVLTYFVNELRVGERATPYSMVTALGPIGPDPPPLDWAFAEVVPADLANDEIVINRWLADDLAAGPGDALEIAYFVFGQGQRLVEETSTFRIRTIVDIAGVADDRTLMPDFPGLADADHCRDWEPGIPVDLDRIRDADEAYWDDYRGTPKAFVTLAAGQTMWSNRFGGMTAIRFGSNHPLGPTLARFRDALDPASIGLFFQDVRGPAHAAGTSATDFGGLFLGLSLFLIVSALLLIALLFAFGVEQRAGEIGLLLGVGFRPADVRHLLLSEAAVIALVGSGLGAVVGVGYTRLVLLGLETIWRDAIGATSIVFHARPMSIVIGAAAAFLSALVTIWFAVRHQVRRPAAALLAGVDDSPASRTGRPTASMVIAVVSVVMALVIVFTTNIDRAAAAAGAFFAAGALLLIATIALSRVLLARVGDRSTLARLSVGTLGVRNAARRAGRSLAVVTLIACGAFLVMSVGANRLDANANAESRSAGTGGFALLARSTIPVPQDLNGSEGREAFALRDSDLLGVDVVSMRLRAGDDASCLNLSVAQQPRLLGVNPDALASRDAFTFTKTLLDDGIDSPWRQLDIDTGPGARIVPAIADAASLAWAMHKRVGDTLDYRDERGRPFQVKIVGAIANSILQGNLIIDEQAFTELYPSESGYRVFLVDAPVAEASAVAERLSRAMSDVGLEVMPTTTRLAEFNAVQNTYLAIFQVLGGLGLLLGTAGLGMVVLRNILERRGELAVLRAVGFRSRGLRWLVFSEHALLLALGLAGGTLAAFVAVLPALRTPGAAPPLTLPAALLVTLAATGVIATWLATHWGLRGQLRESLQGD